MPTHHTQPSAKLQPVPSLSSAATLDELILGRRCICTLDVDLVDLPGPWHEPLCPNHADSDLHWQPAPDDAQVEDVFLLVAEHDPSYKESA